MTVDPSNTATTVGINLVTGTKNVGRVGFGTMAVSGAYGAVNGETAQQAIRTALASGPRLIDTADIYADGATERLIGQIVHAPCPTVVATKVGLIRNPNSSYGVDICGRPEYLQAAVRRSLDRMNISAVDIVYLHRVDRTVPVEESIEALVELTTAGLVRGIGISEASLENIQRAHAVHPLAAVQSEYSLWSRDVETLGILDWLAVHHVPFVASSPLGKGFFVDRLDWPPSDGVSDSRRKLPRFARDSYVHNVKLLPPLRQLARECGRSVSQVALAWIAAKHPLTITIPSSRHNAHVAENLESESLRLEWDQIRLLDQAFAPSRIAGNRHSDMTFVNR